MSVCLIVQKQDEIFIGTDTAICSLVGNSYVRAGEYEEKFFIKDNIGYYCSGKLEIADKIKEYIYNNEYNLNQITSYFKLIDDEYQLNDLDIELMIVTINKCIHISKYNNFKPIEYTINNKDDTYVLSIGFKASENWNKLYNNILIKESIKAIKDTIASSICQEIGGKCKIYHLDKKEFKLTIDERIDNITFQNTKDNQFLINGEVLMGKLLAGNSLVISNSSNTFTVDANGAVLKNATLTVEKGINKILLDPTNGFKIQNYVNSEWTDVVYLGIDGNLKVKGDIYGGSININNKFLVDSFGNMKATSGEFTGTITASNFNQGEITGSSININDNFVVDSSGNLTLAGDVIMGGNITWNSKPSYTAEEIGALPSDTYIPTLPSYIKSTKITSTTIESPTISAGDFYGSLFHGSAIGSAFIKIGVGNGSNLGDLSLYRGGASTPIFQIYDNLTRVDLMAQDESFLATTGITTYAYGTWNFTSANIVGISTMATFG